MSHSKEPEERRRFPRKKGHFKVKFIVTDISSRTPSIVEKIAEIEDYSIGGFQVLTDFPLSTGHVIKIIDKAGTSDLPDFGVVRWIKKEKDSVRAGLFSYFKE